MNGKPLTASMAIILLLILAAGGAVTCSREQISSSLSKNHADDSASSSSLQMNDIFYSRIRGERTFLEISATSAEYHDHPKSAHLEEVHARFYPRSGNSLEMLSPVGHYDLEQEILHLPSGITATTSDGFLIEAELGAYRHHSEEIEFESEVRVTGPNLAAWGKHVQFNTETGILTADEGIEAELAPARVRELLKTTPPPESDPLP